MNLFSLEFIILLCILFGIYYVVPKKIQWFCLLAASIIFYGCSGVKNLIFVGITSFTTWFAGIIMAEITKQFKDARRIPENTREQIKNLKTAMIFKKRLILWVTILLNFGILAYLKYWQTIYESMLSISTGNETTSSLGILLPLGISFYTFQSVGYLIDQYNNAYEPERNYLKYLLFISFFPQMIQGPINRFAKMKEQLYREHYFDWEQIKKGLFLILFGVMKKYAIANMLTDIISAILDSPNEEMPGSVIVAGILMYSAQQYADFSGGIDLVLGIAQLFGISMAPNFRQPYFATSLADFWRRWHISLGAWMRDYVFYPFAFTKRMQKVGKWGIKHLGKETGRVIPACIGNILVFFLVGIWHGAQMHFILWGLYNGIVIAVSELLTPFFNYCKMVLHIKGESRVYHIFCILRTFIIVNIGWYFDRIEKVKDCILCFKNTFFRFGICEFGQYMSMLLEDTLSPALLLIVCAGICFVFIHSYISEKQKDVYDILSRKNIVLRWSVYYILLILIQISMSCATKSEAFMYAVF